MAYALHQSEKAELRQAIQARLQHIRNTARSFQEAEDAEGVGLCEVSRKTLLAAAKKLGVDV